MKIQHGNSQIIMSDRQNQNCIIKMFQRRNKNITKIIKLRHMRKCRGDHREG